MVYVNDEPMPDPSKVCFTETGTVRCFIPLADPGETTGAQAVPDLEAPVYNLRAKQ